VNRAETIRVQAEQLEREKQEIQRTLELFQPDANDPRVGHDRQIFAHERIRVLESRLQDIDQEQATLQRHASWLVRS
jgi:hypothetical protein